ncbi:hypothetical protein NST48_09260 [Paenibacillus sp. FSL M7-0547]|uniref:hypothetical protein n=1 Tax=Paenibacillus sp. FSL M7-0547 TaxID=2954755 RepID=UPI0030FB103D
MITRYSYASNRATKTELLQNVERLEGMAKESGLNIEIIAINQYYPYHCVCKYNDNGRVRQRVLCLWAAGEYREESDFHDYHFEHAPALIKVEEIAQGQAEMDI